MKKMEKWVLFILCIIFVVSTTYYAGQKYTSFQEKKELQQLKEIKEQVHKDSNISSQEEKKEEQIYTLVDDKQILTEYATLYLENSDLYGWLKIEGTSIDYPVMYTPQSPQFYLRRNWNKEKNKSGLLFVDERTSDETENIIIYGHNMKNRTMFGSLKDYKDVNFYEEHKYIEFDTIYEKSTYEIICVSKGVVFYYEEPITKYLYYNHIELDNPEEFDKYINNARNNAYYETGVNAEYGDKLITLSTCDYWTENGRLYIVAKKIS